MADLDLDSTTNVSARATDDPVAEFLAREQSVLGDLEDDLIVNKDSADTAVEATISSTITNADDLFDSNNDIKLNGDINEFEQANGDISNTLSNGISDLSINKQQSASNMDSTIMMSQPIIPAEEPESIKRWRKEHQKNLELKDQEEKIKIEEHRQHAKKELDEWYQRYQEQLEKAKKQNRENSKAAEKEWIAERDNEQPPGQAWEKISRMCDFNPKTSRNNRDTSRMRSILLQLKQNPPASSSAVSNVVGGGGQKVSS